MKSSRFGIDLRTSLLYALLGGTWILLSDRLLLSLFNDPVMLTRAQTYKGWIFVIGSAILIFSLLRADLILRARAEAALREQEEGFRNITERISDVVSVWDDRSRLTYVSPSVMRVLGYAPEALLAGHVPPKLVHPESAPAIAALRERLGAGGAADIAHTEARLRRADGTWAWLDLEATPILTDGRVSGLQVIGHDVTERRRTEEALKQSARSYREIFNAATDAIFVHDADTGAILDVNDSTLRLFGTDRAEALRLTPDMANLGASPYSAVEAQQWMARAIAEGPQLFEWRARKRSGELFWVEVALKRAEIGGRRCVLALVRDISERRRAEAAVRRSEERLRATIQTTPHVAVQWYDGDGRVLFWNRASEQIFGWSAAEALGRTPDQFLVAPQDAAGFPAMLQQIARTGAPLGPVEREFRRRDGAAGTCLSTTFALPASADDPACFVCMDVDITERKRAERQLTLQRDFGLALGNARNLVETLRLCTEAAIAASGLECGGIYLVDEATGAFELACHSGCTEAFAQAARSYPPDSAHARIVLDGRPIYADFGELPLPETAPGRREGFKAVAICPIRQQSRVIGTLNLASRIQDNVPESSRAALETIAGQVGQAIVRDRTLAALQASDRSYREIFDGASDAIFVHDAATGAIVDANASMLALFGFRGEELAGLSLDDVSLGASPYSQAEGRRLLVKAATEGPQRFEWLARKKSGELFWVEVALKSARIGGQPRLLALVRDISQRKQAEEALARERLFTDAVLDSVPGLLYLYDEKGQLVRWNRRHEELTGYTGAELTGRYLLDWFEGEERAQVARGLLRGGRGGHTEVEASLKTRSGALVPFLFTAVPLVIDGRQYVTGIGLDLTERRRAEDELRQLRQDLARVGRVLTLAELGSSIAHELNQPLTAILSNAQAARRFLDRRPVDLGEVRQALADIESADRHAGDVIRRLRDLIGRKEIAHEPVDLNQAIRDVLRLVRAEAVSRDTMTIAQLALDLPSVSGDRVALQQVLLNLVINALDAVREVPATERQVAVRSRREEGGTVAVTVSDTGPGLAPQLWERLFEPFFTTKPDGLGLGLSLSRSLIEAHGGQVWVAPHPEGGLICGFRLPIAPGGAP
ncbi:MAG: PAS domain S-box protein [Candidatus Krumholzibacteriia bacterium]